MGHAWRVRVWCLGVLLLLLFGLAPTHPALSEALTALFDNFRLDIIMQVTQDYLQRSP